MPELSRKNILRFAALLVVSAALCVAYGYFIEPHRLVITRQNIALPNWPEQLDGYKIVAIGDIHAGSNGVDDAKLRSIVAETNALKPNLIVLLGDYVSEKNDTELRMPISEIADGLAGLSAPDGVLAVLGNHDGFTCPSCIKKEFPRVGITVLDNTVVPVTTANGARFRVIGLPDHMQLTYWKVFSDNAKRALAPTEDQGPVIALEHSPDILEVITGDYLISKDLSLILAGHTHGGQVRFPILGAPIVSSSYGQKYTRGLIKQNGVQMFVTSGIGESILPFRFLVPPEIAELTLTADR
ncbi:MAG TPA: metallophosphoesterase [Pyrinomonadaceae bacterium]|nr:metallophosphoesterase [Pyrinomonadaceae bacterium]